MSSTRVIILLDIAQCIVRNGRVQTADGSFSACEGDYRFTMQFRFIVFLTVNLRCSFYSYRHNRCYNMQFAAGPHGAGLSNMVFAPRSASVIEFSVNPHCNRCFGYMAMALDFDYWIVPQVCLVHRLISVASLDRDLWTWKVSLAIY